MLLGARVAPPPIGRVANGAAIQSFLGGRTGQWEDPLFVASPTLYLAATAVGGALPDSRPELLHLPQRPPVLDPSIRLVAADAQRLASVLQAKAAAGELRVEDCSLVVEWGRARLPLLQWIGTRWMPHGVRGHVLPGVTLSTAIGTIHPWRLARAAWRVAPLRTFGALAQLSWLLMMQKIERAEAHRRRRQRILPRILSTLASAFEKMAARGT